MISRIAYRIVDSYLQKFAVGSDSWFRKLLHDQAEDNNIELKPRTNLWQVALYAAGKGGAGAEAEELARQALDIILFRKKTEGEREYHKDYVSSTILRSFVQEYRKLGWSFNDIKKDETIKNWMHKYKISDKILKKIWDKKLKPNKNVSQDLLGKRNKIERGNIFEEYDPNKNTAFETFFIKVVSNEVKTLMTLKNKVDREFQRVQIIPEARDQRSYNPRVIEESHLVSDESEKAQARLTGKDIRKLLKKEEPQYVELIDLMQESDRDPFAHADKPWFAEALKMSVRDFERLKGGLIKTMKDLHEDGQITPQEFSMLLKYGSRGTKKIAVVVLNRILDECQIAA